MELQSTGSALQSICARQRKIPSSKAPPLPGRGFGMGRLQSGFLRTCPEGSAQSHIPFQMPQVFLQKQEPPQRKPFCLFRWPGSLQFPLKPHSFRAVWFQNLRQFSDHNVPAVQHSRSASRAKRGFRPCPIWLPERRISVVSVRFQRQKQAEPEDEWKQRLSSPAASGRKAVIWIMAPLPAASARNCMDNANLALANCQSRPYPGFQKALLCANCGPPKRKQFRLFPERFQSVPLPHIPGICGSGTWDSPQTSKEVLAAAAG